MEIAKNVYADIVFHIFAHMKIDNASNIYDEDYIAGIEKELGRKTVVPQEVLAYYCANFERLAFVNFLPFFCVKNVEELCAMISHTGMATDEDTDKFINPFCSIIREISADYIDLWEQKSRSQAVIFNELEEYIDKQTLVMKRFFDKLYEVTNMKLKLVISESLRQNGRAMRMGDFIVVTLPAPSKDYSYQKIFMQLVHECTHILTDSLLDSIRMDDGSHDVAEYQVILFDLWLFQRDCQELCDAYTEWMSQEQLRECDENLSEEQKAKLRECFEMICS